MENWGKADTRDSRVAGDHATINSPMEHKEIGGQSIHIGDCQVWAAIYYLDSPTDYREFLPAKSSGPQLRSQHNINRPSSPSRLCNSNALPPCTWIIVIPPLLIATVLLYFALSVL